MSSKKILRLHHKKVAIEARLARPDESELIAYHKEVSKSIADAISTLSCTIVPLKLSYCNSSNNVKCVESVIRKLTKLNEFLQKDYELLWDGGDPLTPTE
jgi:hypothetical protein